ncbi:MAG: sugar phosphate isomerase/epimerase [Desulfobacterales bacterium]|nr:sugar phosphate isomerase/epimerase [Desulfobacterales bacterium]
MNIIGTKIDEVRIDGQMDRLVSDLTRIREMGIEAVELPVHGFDVILNGELSPRRMAEVTAILNEFDFTYSVHGPNPVNLMDRDNPDLHARVLEAALVFAREVGARCVVYHGGRFYPEEQFNRNARHTLKPKEKEAMLDQEARWLDTLSQRYPDVFIAVENARPYTTASPYSYAEFMDQLRHQILRINRPNVKINLDFGHLFMTSRFYGFDMLEAVVSVKDLVVHTHVHDNFGGTVHHWEKQQTHQLPFGLGDSHMPVGWGSLPVKEILEILLPQYTGLLMMELRSRYFKDISTSKTNLAHILSGIMGI